MAFGAATGQGFNDTGFIEAYKIIISGGVGNGVFVYSGTPALGNLIESDVASTVNTIDGFGNEVLPVHTFYDNTHHWAMSINGPVFTIYFTTTPSPGPYAWQEESQLNLESGIIFTPVFSGQLALFGQATALLQYFRIFTSQLFVSNGSTPSTTNLMEVDGTATITGLVTLLAGLIVSGGASVAGGLGVGGGTTTDTLDVTSTATLAGTTNATGPINASGQINVTVDPINIEAMSAPTTPGSGVKLWSNGDVMEVTDTTGQVWDTERLTLFAAGQTVNAVAPAAVTGITGIEVEAGRTYHVKGMFRVVQGTVTNSQSIGWSGPATSDVAISYYALENVTLFVSNQITALTTAMLTGAIPNGTAGQFYFDGKITFSASGTLEMTVAAPVAADTWTVGDGSYLEITPAVAT
jgi:hypothetical protein